MEIKVSLSTTDLERIEKVLGITEYDDIHTAMVVALDKLLEKAEAKKYCEMDNTEIRKITYENCPLKCTGCEALCNEMPVGQCRENLSNKFDKE